MHIMPWPLDFALPNAGNNMPANIAMIAITTSSSINVNAKQVGVRTGDFPVAL